MNALLRLVVLAAAVAGLPPVSLHAQTFPAKPVRIIVPYPPGGGVDFMARLIAAKLPDSIGQQVYVDNRPGGGTVIGTELLARAAPDGHTLMMANIAFGANPALQKKLPYDTVKDFAPVALVALVPSFLVVHPSLPVKSVRELVALAKARPGEVPYASAGNGSLLHLTMERFKSVAGINLVHVPYKGAAPALSDVIGGQLAIMFIPGPPALGNIKAGRLRAIGITSAQRLPLMPQVPTVAESGYRDFTMYDWEGLLAPGATPAATVARLNAEINRIMTTPDVKQHIADHCADPTVGTPAELGARIANEITLWHQIVKQSGMTID
jgi:tripartite-type tricarboxylate transporter receptor subunit TctC